MNALTAILTIISTGAVAFVAGGMVSKAHFRAEPTGPVVSREKHRKLLRILRNRYRNRLAEKEALIRRHEAARDDTREKMASIEQALSAKNEFATARETELTAQQETLSHLKQTVAQRNQELQRIAANRDTLDSQLDTQMSRTAAIENELALSQIEREELEARNQRLETERKELVDTMNHQCDTAERQFNHTAIEDQRAELGELREMLANREHKIRELELQLEDKKTRIAAQEARMHEWKHRIAPLTQQLRKHQNMLRRVTEKSQSRQQAEASASATGLPEKKPDNLKEIRGV